MTRAKVLFVLCVVLTLPWSNYRTSLIDSNETSSLVLSNGTFTFYAVVTFEAVDEIIWCDHSNKSYLQFSLNFQYEIWPLELTEILIRYLLSMRLSI